MAQLDTDHELVVSTFRFKIKCKRHQYTWQPRKEATILNSTQHHSFITTMKEAVAIGQDRNQEDDTVEAAWQSLFFFFSFFFSFFFLACYTHRANLVAHPQLVRGAHFPEIECWEPSAIYLETLMQGHLGGTGVDGRQLTAGRGEQRIFTRRQPSTCTKRCLAQCIGGLVVLENHHYH